MLGSKVFTPSYLKLLESGELKKRAEISLTYLKKCRVCPRNCGVNRLENEHGYCSSGYYPIVSSYVLHFGEEPIISGINGAGNIFFGNCNLKCVYCQNYQISQNPDVEKFNEKTIEELANIMLKLQARGAHNIGLVTPSHFVPQIINAIYIAAQKGLTLPIIYNTNAYDSLEMLRLLDGIIDIYLPDFKYGDSTVAEKYSYCKNYYERASEALIEMKRQIKNDFIVKNNVLYRGIIIRHLVLPNNLAESEKVFEFIATNLGKDTYISLMSQYYPANKAKNEPLLSRKIREREYEKAIEALEKFELTLGWIQEYESSDYYFPNFDERKNPFNDSRA